MESLAALYKNHIVTLQERTRDVLARDVYKRQGFESVDYYNLTAGIVALHRGYKF